MSPPGSGSLFKELPAEVQQRDKKNYTLWKSNPNHPSLDFKQAHTRRAIYSMKVGMGWRVLGSVEGEVVTWFWIGSHNHYDKLLKQL
jgi:hypothetical protein